MSDPTIDVLLEQFCAWVRTHNIKPADLQRAIDVVMTRHAVEQLMARRVPHPSGMVQ